MSKTEITLPPGFVLEQGEPLGDQRFPGSELEQEMAGSSIQLPQGFELEQPVVRTQVASAPVSQASADPTVAQMGKTRGNAVQPRRATVARPNRPPARNVAPLPGSNRNWRAKTVQFSKDAQAKFSDSGKELPSSAQLTPASSQTAPQQVSWYRGGPPMRPQQPEPTIAAPSQPWYTTPQKPRPSLGATPSYIPPPASKPATPKELAAGERVRQYRTPEQQKLDNLVQNIFEQNNAPNFTYWPSYRARAAEESAAISPTRKPLNAREAMERGYPTALDRTLRKASALPEAQLDPAFQEQGFGPSIRMHAKLLPTPLEGETFAQYLARQQAAADYTRPRWAKPIANALKAVGDYPAAAAKWGHDTAADAAELYLNANGIYSPTAVGIARGTAGFVGGMATDPTTYLLGGVGGFGGKVGQKLMARGFQVYAGLGGLEQSKQLLDVWNRDDIPYEQKVEMGTGIVLNSAMAGFMSRHGREPGKLPIERELIDTIHGLGKWAAADILSRSQERYGAVGDQLAERLKGGTQPPPNPSAQTMLRYEQRVGNLPKPKPQAPPNPPGPEHLTPELIQQLTDKTANLPEVQRGDAMAQAHQLMTAWMLDREGKPFMGPTTSCTSLRALLKLKN